MFSSLQKLFFPERCVKCHVEGKLLCVKCASILAPQLTLVAKKPRTYSLLNYHDFAVKGLLRAWKYQGNQSARKYLLEALPAALPALRHASHPLIVPIPTRRAHDLARGFSPPQHIALELHHITSWEIVDCLTFAHHTMRQSKLSLAKRKKNMHNALVVRERLHLARRSVILVDDVTTTGATLSAAASALYSNGATDVRAITLAWNP